MAKRAKNEGTIFQRKSDGRWVGRIQIGVVRWSRLSVSIYSTRAMITESGT